MDELEAVSEIEALRRLWDFVWNDLATYDYGDHQGMSQADDNRLADLAEAVTVARLAAGLPETMAHGREWRP